MEALLASSDVHSLDCGRVKMEKDDEVRGSVSKTGKKASSISHFL
jgi:hypothetical protein